jgi:molybdate transport system substrate-binding protein
MEVAVPPKNPAHVTGLVDLGRRGVKVALCEPQVPCGATAAKVFATANLSVNAVTLEPDDKSVLAKVQLGEVDAGVAYVTDVRAAGTTVAGVEIPPSFNASTQYPIAALRKSKNTSTAKAFVDFVLGPQGRAVLLADGFLAP